MAAPQLLPVSHTASRVHSALGTISAFPAVASSTVSRDTPASVAGFCRFLTCNSHQSKYN